MPLFIVLLLTASAAATPVPLPTLDQVQPALTTRGDPAGYVVTAPSFFDGVARLAISTLTGGVSCSGALLSSGWDVLTAAHCLTDGAGKLDVTALTASFFTVGDQLDFTGAAYSIHPGFIGTIAGGNDIAVIRLSMATGLSGYGLATSDPFGPVTLAGYGRSGTGVQGHVLPWGTLRSGQNTYDAVWGYPGFPYAYDFDDGTAARDTFCLAFSLCHTGVPTEVLGVPGDSGGPTFYGGYVVGVHSFYGRLSVGDLDGVLNGTFGEVGGDTRVAAYADWIRLQMVPEPGVAGLVALGLLAFALWRRRPRA